LTAASLATPASPSQTTAFGGYNQLSWYSAGGGDHRYSSHNTDQLIWGSLGNRSKVSRVNRQGGHWYELYEIPEMWVKVTVRSLVQP